MRSRETVSMFSQIVRGGGWALGGRCGAVASLMLMNALLTRILGPDQVGAFFLIFSVVATAASLSQLGLPLALVNLIGEAVARRQPGRVRGAIRTTLVAASAMIILAALALLVLGHTLAECIFHSPMTGSAIKLTAAWLAVRGLQTLLAEIFRALKDLSGATLHSGLLSTILSVIGFAAIWHGTGHASLADALWISMVAGILDVCIAGMGLRIRMGPSRSGSDSVSFGELMRIAWPLWGALMVWTLGRENDIWVLGMFRPRHEIALYGGAVRLAALAAMPLMVVNAVVPPFIAELHGGGRTRDLELMLRAAATAAMLPTVCVLGIFVFEGRALLAALYGPFYADANAILLIWGASALTDVATGACGLALMMTGRGSQVLWISLGGALLALAVKLVLVRRYGGLGVAVGAAIGYGAQNLAMLVVVRRELGIWTSILGISDSAPVARTFIARLRQPLTT